MLLTHVREEVGAVLHLDPGLISEAEPFKDLGVDSLMGVELRNRFRRSTGQALPSTLIWTYPTPYELAAHLCSLLREETGEVAPSDPDSEVAIEDEMLAGLLELEERLDT